MLLVSRWKKSPRFLSPSSYLLILSRLLATFPPGDISHYTTRIQELCRLGRVPEARGLFDAMPRRDAVAWNSMIFGYSLNGMMDDARALFDAFAGRNVRTWTILVSAHARNGSLEEARLIFDAMPERNTVSWNAMISGYVQNGDVFSARRLFDEMPERDAASWNSMITGYCHAHRMGEARRLFEQMPARDLVSWTVMVSGYAQLSEHHEAWGFFRRMHQAGVRADRTCFTAAVSVVMGLCNLTLLENLRTLAIKADLESGVVVGTRILNAYTKDSAWLDEAKKFFELMPDKNEYSWSTLIAAFSQVGQLNDAIFLYKRDPLKSFASQTAMLTGYAQNGRIDEARLLFEQMSNQNIVSWNAMITGYVQNDMLDDAKRLFNRMPSKNEVSWAAMISGCAQNGESEEALHLLSELHRSGILPSLSCFTSGFLACSNIGALEIGKQLHSLSLKAGAQFNSYVSNGLITMYAKCKNMKAVSEVFGWMRSRDTVSWNSLITAMSQNNMLEDARTAFEKMSKRDVVSWTAIISAYVQAENEMEALGLFLRMLDEGILPNALTLTSILSSCGSLGAAKLGRQIHAICFKIGFALKLFVGNALITMYFKCGCADAFWVFDEMAIRDRVTLHSILAGCAQHGFGREAVDIFEQMKSEGIFPDHVTFLVLLCACSHSGLLDEGWHYFESMRKDYGIMPQEDHYACMVDLLGRMGLLCEAEAFIENMPIEPDAVVWGALLGACRIHQNVELGQRTAERLFDMDPQKPSPYILLSNIYASLGMWNEVEEVRKMMNDRGVVRKAGTSWTQLRKRIHSFVSGSKQHVQVNMIYASLKKLHNRTDDPEYSSYEHFSTHDGQAEQNKINSSSFDAN